MKSFGFGDNILLELQKFGHQTIEVRLKRGDVVLLARSIWIEAADMRPAQGITEDYWVSNIWEHTSGFRMSQSRVEKKTECSHKHKTEAEAMKCLDGRKNRMNLTGSREFTFEVRHLQPTKIIRLVPETGEI